MSADVRRDKREKASQEYRVCWDEQGLTRSISAKAVDRSVAGLGLRCSVSLPVGTRVYIEAPNSSRKGYGVVRHCTPTESGSLLGIELEQKISEGGAAPLKQIDNYYELLQISSNAELSTIERIYRFLATRYHPDNPQTGDPEHFIAITRAYEVLSDRDRRATYDRQLGACTVQPNPVFQSVDFMDGVEGEVNRRVAVLALLYHKCRTAPDDPRVSLADLESRMGFPREYLDFTTWYLRAKKYITREDNSDFALTALGVDYVEENYTKSPILHELLGTGSGTAHPEGATDTSGHGSRPSTPLQLKSAEALRRQAEHAGSDEAGANIL